jgi:16S rRNA (adenine1518-N6/adenine1519-N6)-dimethyltransferase
MIDNNQYKALKKYGQNFLKDQNIINKIVNLLAIENVDRIIEIGPGLGALTKPLVNKNKPLDCYEVDERMVEYLNTNLQFANLTVYHQDFLKTNLTQYANQKLAFISNLPYYITTPILFKIIESKLNYASIVVMMQKEVAERLTGKINTKDYNALTIILNAKHDITKEFDVSPNVFIPAPRVTSSVIKITPNFTKYQIDDFALFTSFVKQSFEHRRKTIYNNLKPLFDNNNQVAKQFLNQSQIQLNERAENISIESYVMLANKYNKLRQNGKISNT